MKIIIAGDYCPYDRVKELLNIGKYENVFGEVKDITKDSDYSIVNLECPVVYNNAKPIEKCGPNLCCKKNGIEALKWAGFDCVTLANNHFYDFGEVGVKDTIDACGEHNLDYVGGGVDLKDSSKILYKSIAGKKLAIINCCEHEFSIATEISGGSNPLNVVQQYYAIQEAKKNADNILVIVHGGVELFWLPSKRMIETYRFFIDAGADAVVNHHQHCYSGYEVYKGKPIFYGLGNFCFDGGSIGNGERWTSGFMAEIEFGNEDVKYVLYPYRQCAELPEVKLMEGSDLNEFNERLRVYNSLIADDIAREKEYQKWCEQTERIFKTAINPCYNRFSKFFFDSSYGMKFLNARKLLRTLNVIMNESHLERLIIMVNRMTQDSKSKKFR